MELIERVDKLEEKIVELEKRLEDHERGGIYIHGDPEYDMDNDW